MDCRQVQDLLDNVLVAEPTAAEQAELAQHLAECPDCAAQHAEARQALAVITPTSQFDVSPDYKERVMHAISVAGVFRPQPAPATIRVYWSRRLKMVAALAAAAMLLVALWPLLRPGPGQGGSKGFSAFGLLSEAYAAEEKLFTGSQIVHLLNEIIVTPVADATMAKIRWLPLFSLEATGKPRFNQLTLPAEVDKGYTVEDQSWYDPATGRFVRVLTASGKPIFATSYDGTNVCSLEMPAARRRTSRSTRSVKISSRRRARPSSWAWAPGCAAVWTRTTRAWSTMRGKPFSKTAPRRAW